MANTYTLIEAKTLSSSIGDVTFTSIPQTYTDLKIVASPRTDRGAGADWFGVTFNGSTSGYSSKWLEGNGSGTPGSFSGPTTYGYVGVINGSTSTSSTFSNVEIYIPNYTISQYKSYSVDSVQETNATGATMELGAGLWSNTAAITYMNFFPTNSALFVSGSTFYLYGIKNS
jgi:hypothetical protein